MSVAIITSVYGDFDIPKPVVKQDQDCEYILVTDNPDKIPSGNWNVIHEPRDGFDTRLQSRVAKCNPWLYTDADITIWIDGNIEVTSSRFADWCLENLGDNQVCQHQLDRPSIWDEAKGSVSTGKWEPEPIHHMVEHYLSQGYPVDHGIWWCGLMVRDRNTIDLGDRWMTEMVRWTCQDQMSWAFLLWEQGLFPAELPVNYHNSIAALTFSYEASVHAQADYFKLHRHTV